MSTLKNLLQKSTNKSNFKGLDDFFNFANEYLEFIETGLQAKIVAQNEINYTFFQFFKENLSYLPGQPFRLF